MLLLQLLLLLRKKERLVLRLLLLLRKLRLLCQQVRLCHLLLPLRLLLRGWWRCWGRRSTDEAARAAVDSGRRTHWLQRSIGMSSRKLVLRERELLLQQLLLLLQLLLLQLGLLKLRLLRQLLLSQLLLRRRRATGGLRPHKRPLLLRLAGSAIRSVCRAANAATSAVLVLVIHAAADTR